MTASCFRNCTHILAISDGLLSHKDRNQSGDDTKQNTNISVDEHVNCWLKFREPKAFLGYSLSEVEDRWAEGQGPLALHFTQEELQVLLTAIFENTGRRETLFSKSQDI